MSLHHLVPPATLLLLVACAAVPAPEAEPPAASVPGRCDAAPAQVHVGQPADEATLQAVQAATGARSLRSLKPGQAMTMDYREDRVNVVQDAEGRIDKISCG